MTASTRALVAVIGYEALTALPTAAMPAFVGHYVEAFGYGLEQAGFVSSVETVGMALGQLVVLVVFAKPGWNLRRSMSLTLCCFAAAQFLSLWPQYVPLFATARFVSGFTGGGMVFAAAGLYIASLEKPDRPYALFYGALFVVGPLGLFGLPRLFELVGARGIYLSLGIAVVASLAAIRSYPATREAKAGVGGITGDGRRIAPLAIASTAFLLASLFINYISNGGVWVYMERIGAAMAIPETARGNYLGIGMLCGVLGSVAAIACARAVGRFRCIVAGQLLLLLSYALLRSGEGDLAFLAAAIVLNVAVTFFTPFYLSKLSDLDVSGRSATLGMITFGLGYGFGPAVLALFLGSGDFDRALGAASVAVLISLLLLGGAAILERRKTPGVLHDAL